MNNTQPLPASHAPMTRRSRRVLCLGVAASLLLSAAGLATSTHANVAHSALGVAAAGPSHTSPNTPGDIAQSGR